MKLTSMSLRRKGSGARNRVPLQTRVTFVFFCCLLLLARSQLPQDIVVDCGSILSEPQELDGEVVPIEKFEQPFQMHVHAKDADDVSRRIIENGCYECDTLPFTLRALKSRPDSVFLDIGANLGLYSLAAAAAGHQVVAFEPVFHSYRKICQSIAANKFEKDITLVTRAVSSESGNIVKFGVWSGNFAGYDMHTANSVEKLKFTTLSKEGINYARTITIDSLPRGSLLPTDRPVVVKADVEGNECKALLGAMKYLKEVEVLFLQMETANHRFEKDPCYRSHDIIGFLVGKGMKPYLIHDGQLTPLDPANYKSWKSPKIENFDIGWVSTKYGTEAGLFSKTNVLMI